MLCCQAPSLAKQLPESVKLVEEHLCVPFQCSFIMLVSKAASASCGVPACSCAPDTLKHVPAHKVHYCMPRWAIDSSGLAWLLCSPFVFTLSNLS